MRRRAVQIALLTGGLVSIPASAALGDGPVFTFADARITESSGLVDLGATMVTTNDSGSAPVLFSVAERTGRTVAVTRYGAETVDVEALAPAGGRTVWVGDIGDQRGTRRFVTVHRVPVGPGRTAPRTQRFRLAYPGGGRDAEAMFADRAGRLHLITKSFRGGAGRTYQFSTAPAGATGDGIAMAWRAGARVSNMEFMQFHPTCLYNLEVKNFLITEAVRGEGGRLINPQTGKRFMPFYDKREELAPRDIVARAIDAEIKRFGLDYVHLDISHMPADFVKGHFPNIYEKLIGLGIDMTTAPIPVVPAQHYTCGGIVIDREGCTDLPHLWAAGECTQSGLHGANRLASNSLLECFVFGEAAARDITRRWDNLAPPPVIRPWDESRVTDSDEEVVIKQNWTEIRRFMWNYVGIVRTTKRLKRAANRIQLLNAEVADYYGHFRVTPDLIELRNLLQSAELIVKSALHRDESRGLHFTLDYPDTAEQAVDTVLVP